MFSNSYPMPSPEEMLTPKEAAFRLRVSLSLIYKMIREGDLPATRIGEKLIRIKPADLDALYRPSAN